ncbi:MAG: tRNA guanosine(34) transglycosylase Tgt [Parcubacteria group bacterium]|nr:MAG: tRNA guanosine(34) transglycosylase Tgt [Parcubacteria group bacterium]
MFKILKKSKKSKARLGVLTTAHGRVDTPFFMPIATKGAVKSLTSGELKKLGAQIILSNTYHNYIRPGVEVFKKFGGLHNFMQTDLPILTDSGGYQVFSLSNLRKIIGDSVRFRSYLDGAYHTLDPKKVIDIQVVLGSDIMMVLDECVELPTTRAKALRAVERTSRWAQLAFDYKNKLNKKSTKIKKQLLFGIVQGGDYRDLRLRSAQELTSIPFDGYAVGGLAVGEPNETMYKVLDYTVPELPENKPRYLMGVGYPENIIESVKRGIDMFDCVIPTREARHGKLYNFSSSQDRGSKSRSLTRGKFSSRQARANSFYETIQITRGKFKADKTPINQGSLKNYSRAYLHHLFKSEDPLALRLATINNLEFYLQLMKEIGVAIKTEKL